MSGLLAFQDWLPEPIRKCLLANTTKLLSRITPEGRQASRALHQWTHAVQLIAERKAQAKRVLASVSPEGRAMAKTLRSWSAFAIERKRKMAHLQSALARMLPEGRLKHQGLIGFRARTPSWTEGPYRYVSPDGFWVTSARTRERESVVGSPEVCTGSPTNALTPPPSLATFSPRHLC